MRSAILALGFVLAAPAMSAAQGWEIRAGLSGASATGCTEDGSCFGVHCNAVDGWTPGWLAVLNPETEEPPEDPILAIRMDGQRFALTSLRPDGDSGTYTAAIADPDSELLETLQRAESIEVDPGRDFGVVQLSLRGSRWAVREVLDLCDVGGPYVFVPDEEAAN